MFERFGDGLIHNIWEICWLGLDYHVSLILISELAFEYHYNLSASCITSSVDIYLRSIFTVGMRSLIYGWVLSIWFMMFERFADDFIRLIYDVREICCWFDSSYLRDSCTWISIWIPYNLSASSITYCITSSVDIYLRSIFTVGMRSLIYGWVLSIWFIMFERFIDWIDSSCLIDLLIGLIHHVWEIYCWFGLW
jgi:hypothetical protein